MKKIKKPIRGIISILLVLLMVTPFATIASAMTGYVYYNEGAGRLGDSDSRYSYGSSVTLSGYDVQAPNSSKGQSFIGWSTSRNGSVSYYPGDTYYPGSSSDVLYARYGYYGFALTNTSSYISLDKTYRPLYTTDGLGTKYEFSFVTGSSVPANGCIFQWYGSYNGTKGNGAIYFNSSAQLVVATLYGSNNRVKTFSGFTFKPNTFYYLTVEFLNDFNDGVTSNVENHPIIVNVYDVDNEGEYGMYDPIFTKTLKGFAVNSDSKGTTLLGASSSSDFKVAPNILLCSFKSNRGLYCTGYRKSYWGTSTISVTNHGRRNVSANYSNVSAINSAPSVTAWTISNAADNISPTVYSITASTTNENGYISFWMDDNEMIDGYYLGTSSFYYNNSYYKTGEPKGYAWKEITEPGTYYFTAKDVSGNVSSTYSRTLYKTTFNANGGSVSKLSQITPSSGTVTLPTPTRSGYTCLGWSTSNMATSAEYSCGASYKPTANTTLYAVWKKAKGEGTFSLNLVSETATSVVLSVNLDSGEFENADFTISYGENIGECTKIEMGSSMQQVQSNHLLSACATVPYMATVRLTTFSPTNITGQYFLYTFPKKINKSVSKSDFDLTVVSPYDTYELSAKVVNNLPDGDTIKPTGSISSTNNVAASQTVTLSLSDNVGVAGYYWGTSSTYSNNTYTSTSSSSVTKTISSSGTYYLTVKDTSGNVSSNSSVTFYKTTLNANGGSVSPISVLTKSGNSFTFPTPTRSGYTYNGWSTSSSATSGVVSLSPKSNSTYYALWVYDNIYNLGEETYSFNNFGDSDSPGGHCFGMAVTSSGYYIGALSKTIINGSDNLALYSFKDTNVVRKPICHYLQIQGPGAEYKSIVAGGSIDLNRTINTKSDWNSCVNYVKGHAFDNTGKLNAGMWFADGGGHAVNFLYYKEIGGQQRIYVYDNNFPEVETYYYMGSDGYIHQAPYETDSFGIIGIDLMDVNNYFKLAPEFKRNRYVYADKNEVVVEGAKVYNMKCSGEYSDYVMYEVPDNVNEVSIKPLKNNASFVYCDDTYSFNTINSKTSATLKLKSKDSTPSQKDDFQILNEPGTVKSVSINDVELRYKDSAKLNPKIEVDGGVKYTVEYKSSDNKIATVDNNGNVKGVKDWGKKTATITCTVTDEYGNKVSDTCNVTVGYAWWQWIIGIVLFGWIWY